MTEATETPVTTEEPTQEVQPAQIALTDPRAQKEFDGRAIYAAIGEVRQALALAKLNWHLTVKNVGVEGAGHPEQAKKVVQKLDGQLEVLQVLAAELNASEIGIAGPSALEVVAPRLARP